MIVKQRNRKLGWIAAGIAAVGISRKIYMEMTRYQLKSRVVLITGGSRGLGLVLARQLARRGAYLALCARSTEELEAARKEFTEVGTEVFTTTADVTRMEEVEAMVAGVISRFGRIDVLINNAGIIQVGPQENMTMEDYEKAMQTHFWGPLQVIQSVLPHFMSKNEGRIVNITSIGGKVAVPHLLPYSASKFALVGLSEGLHAELKKHHIHVTTVVPNLMRTGSPRNITVKGDHEEEYALFKRVGSNPLVSQNAETAARSIISAIEFGRAEAVLSVTGKLLTILKGIAPGWVTTAMEWTNRYLPAPTGQSKSKKGYQAESKTSSKGSARRTDKAAIKNNEMKASEKQSGSKTKTKRDSAKKINQSLGSVTKTTENTAQAAKDRLEARKSTENPATRDQDQLKRIRVNTSDNP